MEVDRQVRNLEYFVATNNRSIYGMQWGDPDELGILMPVRDMLLDSLSQDMTVLEIGSGGGRWSRYFRENVTKAILVDASTASETCIRTHCDWSGFEFLISHDGLLPQIPDCSVDLAFSFDVFVHFHRELFEAYLADVYRVLKPGAKWILHYAKSYPEPCYNDECFYFYDDADFANMATMAGFDDTGAVIEFREGHGSVLRVLRRR